MEFSGKKYGSLPKPDEGADDETVIFMPNDPNVIESSHLWETSKRKPDVIGVPISFVHEVHEELKGMDYKQLSTKVSKESRKNLKPSRDTEWPDVYVTCELKMMTLCLKGGEVAHLQHKMYTSVLSQKVLRQNLRNQA